MARLPIVQAPHPVLNQIAKPVTFEEKNLRQLILNMEETLFTHDDPPGVGLAAPQVAVSLKIFLVLLGTTGKEINLKNSKIEVFINPEIIKTAKEPAIKTDRRTAEGCLSLKNYYGQVIRSPKITVKYQTVDTSELQKTEISDYIKTKQATFTDFEARIIQHEMDHLNGRLFTSRVLEQQGKLYQVTHDHGKDAWEEVDLLNF